MENNFELQQWTVVYDSQKWQHYAPTALFSPAN